MHKPSQGMTSRIGVLVLGVLLAFYAGRSWQLYFSPFKDSLQENLLHHSFLLGVLLFGLVAAFTLFLALFNPKSVDYLIDMDGELRKVVWPAVQPLFDPKAEAWGSSYVVIACTIILTVYIALVDMVLQKGITEGILKLLY